MVTRRSRTLCLVLTLSLARARARARARALTRSRGSPSRDSAWSSPSGSHSSLHAAGAARSRAHDPCVCVCSDVCDPVFRRLASVANRAPIPNRVARARRRITTMTAPPLELGSSSVTVLRSGADFVVAAGLCGWLRAWQLRAEPSEEVCTAHGCLSLHSDTLLSLSLSLSPFHILSTICFRRGCSFLTSGARTTCRMDARAPTRSGLSRWPKPKPSPSPSPSPSPNRYPDPTPGQVRSRG